MEVLLAHLVVRAMITPFQRRPETFNPVCVDHTPDIFTDRVADSLMVRQSPIAPDIRL